MFSILGTVLCGCIALGLWTAVGFSIAIRMTDRRTAIAIGPLVGWAVLSACSLPVFYLTGMSRFVVTSVAVLSLAVAIWSVLQFRDQPLDTDRSTGVPVWALCAAAILSIGIMAAVVPHFSPLGTALAPAIFDHSKIAIADEIMRNGAPPANPFFAEADGPHRLAYYYLWHFSAAQIALLAGSSAWEADAALTWFTAFASLSFMMGLARWLGGSLLACAWVLIFAFSGSLRPVLDWIFGTSRVAILAGWPTGFNSWIFQSSWAPQHTASAACSLLSVFALCMLARQPSLTLAAILAALAAATFESSSWIGAIVLPPTIVGITILLWITSPRRQFRQFILYGCLAGIAAVTMAFPLIYDQFNSASLRAEGFPIVIKPQEVLDDYFSDRIRRLFDPAAYWLILLVVEFAAVYVVGIAMAVLLKRRLRTNSEQSDLLSSFVVLAVVSFCVGWMLVSTAGNNNDLAWRGVLPALLALIVFAATGVSLFWPIWRGAAKLSVATIVVLSLFDSAHVFSDNAFPKQTPSAKEFETSFALWDRVRKYASPLDRIVNNPDYLKDMTPWPVNISWALMSHRRSCYAGSDLVLPFSGLNAEQRKNTEAVFTRLFNGTADPDDVRALGTRYQCKLVIFTPRDSSWLRDPLQNSATYEIVEATTDLKIYRLIQP
jgi:hypothetical protein